MCSTEMAVCAAHIRFYVQHAKGLGAASTISVAICFHLVTLSLQSELILIRVIIQCLLICIHVRVIIHSLVISILTRVILLDDCNLISSLIRSYI